MSDPAVTAAIAAGRVPSTISEAYLNESRDQSAIAAILFIGALTLVIVGLRLASRLWLIKHFGIDDALALFSVLLFIPFIVLCMILIKIGSGRHYDYIQHVMTMEVVEQSEILDFAAHLVYTSALVVCRISGLAFYHRICGQHTRFLLAIKITAGVLVAAYLPQMFLIIFHCLPVTGLWPYDWQPGFEEYTCLTWGIVYCTNSGLSLFCDALLFGIPIAMLRILEMPPKRKIQLACILLPGIFVVAISIARLVLVIQGQWEADMSWVYNPMLTVEVSEIGATLIALSVPGVKPLFEQWVLRKGRPAGSTGGSHFQSKGSHAHGTALRSLRPSHNALSSKEDFTGAGYDVESGSKDDRSMMSSDSQGILVRVDFKMKEDRSPPGAQNRNELRKA